MAGYLGGLDVFGGYLGEVSVEDLRKSYTPTLKFAGCSGSELIDLIDLKPQVFWLFG